MKNFYHSLGSLGLVSLLILGTSVNSSHANERKSPLRGSWSFSQLVPATSFFGTPAVPTATVGAFIVDEDNNLTGHGVLDTAPSTFEFDFTGSCTFRQGNLKNGMDCIINVPAFGLTEGRFCVAMGKRGECYDEFRCVDTTEGLGSVALSEFRRQRPGTCQ